jgi:hypothetical protein
MLVDPLCPLAKQLQSDASTEAEPSSTTGQLVSS